MTIQKGCHDKWKSSSTGMHGMAPLCWHAIINHCNLIVIFHKINMNNVIGIQWKWRARGSKSFQVVKHRTNGSHVTTVTVTAGGQKWCCSWDIWCWQTLMSLKLASQVQGNAIWLSKGDILSCQWPVVICHYLIYVSTTCGIVIRQIHATMQLSCPRWDDYL